MSFSTEMARLVAGQLARFVTLNRHQLAGQAANLDFWLGQARNAMDVLDGYSKRFQRLKTAQVRHVSEHHTTEFALDDPCCTQRTPAPPSKVPKGELSDARRALGDATRRFLVRCCNERLIDESVLRRWCADLDISVDRGELKPGSASPASPADR